MGMNKISEKLFEIINNKITSIELPNSTLTEVQNVISINEKETEIYVNDHISKISLPVSVDGLFPVIINFSDLNSIKSSEVKSILKEANIKNEYSIIPAIAVNLNADQITKLAGLPQIDLIEFDDYAVATLTPQENGLV